MIEPMVGLLVLILALIHMPSGKPIFNFAVGSRILFDYDYQNAALGQQPRDFRSCGRSANHCHYVTRTQVFSRNHGSTPAQFYRMPRNCYPSGPLLRKAPEEPFF